MGIFRLPGQAYDYVHHNFGWWGVAFAVLGVVLCFIGTLVWLDRRR
jgi:hypothetical protein